MESDEQKRLIEAVILAEQEGKEEFTASTEYLNDFGPQAHLQIKNLAAKAQYVKSRKWLAADFIAARIQARVDANKMALIATRSREGRFIDVVTVQRTKYAVSGPQEAKGLTQTLKQGMGLGGGQSQQQQASMF